MTDFVDVVVLITPNGDWGAVKLEEGEHPSEVAMHMMESWKTSVPGEQFAALNHLNPTVVHQRMTADGYHRIGARYGHWVNQI